MEGDAGGRGRAGLLQGVGHMSHELYICSTNWNSRSVQKLYTMGVTVKGILIFTTKDKDVDSEIIQFITDNNESTKS